MMDKTPEERFWCCVVDWRKKFDFLVQVSALIPGVWMLRNPGALWGGEKDLNRFCLRGSGVGQA